MVSKKKAGKSLLGVEVAELSRFNEDFEEAMREFKEQLEAKRLERQKAFKEYEKQYQKAKDENYCILGAEFLKLLNLDHFGSLKELMADEENKKALNAKKDFAVLFEKNNKFIRKVFAFIANDELVRTALDEFIEDQKKKEDERLGSNAKASFDDSSEEAEDVVKAKTENTEASSLENGETVSYGLRFDGGDTEKEYKASAGADDEPVLL